MYYCILQIALYFLPFPNTHVRHSDLNNWILFLPFPSYCTAHSMINEFFDYCFFIIPNRMTCLVSECHILSGISSKWRGRSWPRRSQTTPSCPARPPRPWGGTSSPSTRTTPGPPTPAASPASACGATGVSDCLHSPQQTADMYCWCQVGSVLHLHLVAGHLAALAHLLPPHGQPVPARWVANLVWQLSQCQEHNRER